MINKTDITGIILAGGKSSRMGTDKGFMIFNGKPFAKYSIDAVKSFVSNIIIASNHSEYDNFGLKRVADFIEDAGPLAGIYTGLKHSKTEYNIVLSCDIPLITSEIIELLVNQIDSDSDVIQIVSNQRSMPLIAIYKKQCETLFLDLLQQGERRLWFALNQCKVKNVVLNSELELFTRNINTPEQLNQITE